jgi:hypothetical protein
MSLFGRLLYKLYYQPLQRKHTLKRFGGKENYEALLSAEQDMKVYALEHLEMVQPSGTRTFKINFLTGEKYIHQTLFCVYSLFKQLSDAEKADLDICFFDDGSLTPVLLSSLAAKFPFIKVMNQTASMATVENVLPSANYPFIHKKLSNFPLMKKLVYIHAGNSGLNCFFDSDMLFLKKPAELLEWLSNNADQRHHAFGIFDVMRSYGYTIEAVNAIYSEGVVHNINSGLYAVHSDQIDFDLVEYLIKGFETRYGPNYYQEQLITAILLERSKRLHMAAASDFIVMPTKEQTITQAGVLQHYVAESKEWYFRKGWQQLI